MDAGSSHPPNLVFLSYKTIGVVKPRWPPRHDYVEEVRGETTGVPAASEPQPQLFNLPRKAYATSSLVANPAREQRKRYQAHYRKKQQQRISSLEDDVQRLCKEVKKLEYWKLCGPDIMPPTPNIWAIALEYLRIFRHGFKPSTNERTALVLTFLQKFMAPDVSDGYFFGPQALLRNWELFSRCFGDVQVDLNSMESITEDILSATTTTSITISSNTLKLVFPHLNSDGYGGADGGAWSALAKRLEGQRLVMRSTVKFHWDNMNMRVVQMQTRSDMLTAVYHVLGSWEAVNHVFDGAFLTPECTFTSTSEHRYSW